MRYGISKGVAGFSGFIEIDETEYKLIKRAMENSYEALFLEEKLDLVTENYYEYETELLLMASRLMLFGDDDYFSTSRDRDLASRRMFDLLSAVRMYRDQSVQHIRKMYGRNSDNYNWIKEEFKSPDKQSLGYRFMEALRDYAQHFDFPIHAIKFSYKRVEVEEDSKLLFRVIPLISISALEEDKAFEKSVLKELRDTRSNDRVDASSLIREYVEGMSTIHEEVRRMIRSDLTDWEKILDDTIVKFQNEFGKDTSPMNPAIVTELDDGSWKEEITIFKEFIEKRHALEKKNQHLINLQKSYVSNEILEEDA